MCLHPMGVHVNEALTAQLADSIKFIPSVPKVLYFYILQDLWTFTGRPQKTMISTSLY